MMIEKTLCPQCMGGGVVKSSGPSNVRRVSPHYIECDFCHGLGKVDASRVSDEWVDENREGK